MGLFSSRGSQQSWFRLLMIGCASCLLGTVSGADPTLNYAYTYTLTPVSTSYLQQVSSSSVTGNACTSVSDCQSKCPTANFFTDGNATAASLEQQLTDCTNALRTAPEVFADAINAVCSLSAFQSSITSPRRSALASSAQLSQIAEAHSNDMAANNSFSHTSSSGASPADRIRADFPNANAIGEVIAAGYSTVRDVVVNLMCSDSHRAIITSCSYDTLGWGVEIGSTLNGQQIRSTYSSYFTGDFLCSDPSGCSCPANAQEFGSPSGQPNAASPAVSSSPPAAPPVVSSPPPAQQSPPAQQQQPGSPPSTAASPPPATSTPPPATASPPPASSSPPPASSSPPPASSSPPPAPSSPPPAPSSPSPASAAQQSPPQQQSVSPPPTQQLSPSPPPTQQSPPPAQQTSPPAGGQPPPQADAVAIIFDVIFNAIPATSLNSAQLTSVIQDLRNAIANYVLPTTVGISINGTGPPPAPAPSNPPSNPASSPPPQTSSPPPSGDSQGGIQGNNPPGFPPPPINYNPPSPTGFPPPPINYNPPSPTGFPPPPINYNPPSPTGFPPPPINYNPPSPTTRSGRRLQQSENTLQPTVTFLATTSASSSADTSGLITDLTSAINAYTAPTTVTVTATSQSGGSTAVLNVSVVFPPNNQVSNTPSYTTELASSFGSAIANQTSTVLASFISKDGPVTVSGVQTLVSPVTATAGSNLGPPAPIPVVGSQNQTGAASAAASSPPPTTASPPPTTASPPPTTASPPLSPASPPPTPASPPPIAASPAPAASSPPPAASSPPPTASSPPLSVASPPPTAASPPPQQSSPSPSPAPSPPPSPVPTPPAGLPPPSLTPSSPSAAVSLPPSPVSQPLPLVLEATVTYRANETALIQNFTNALQSNPQAVLYPLIASDGNITVENVQNTAGSSAAIEEAAPLPPVASPTSPPTAGSSLVPAPAPSNMLPTLPSSTLPTLPSSTLPTLPSTAPGITPTISPSSITSSTPGIAPSTTTSSCSLFALNMQFTTGRAATDSTSATLMAGFPTKTGPVASQFTVLLSGSQHGSVEAVVPYSSSFFLVKVATPESYYGPVTVSYATSELEPLTYYVVPSLVVKVTASSLTAAT